MKISWRNLFKHKVKSIVIGIIIILGAFLMTIGNGILSGMDKGFSENIVNSFTGDLVIVSKEQKADDVLFGMQVSPIEIFENYKGIINFLDNESMIDSHLSVAKGYALILNEGSGILDTYLIGIEIEKYEKMFPNNIRIVKGENLKKDEGGLLLTEVSRDLFYDFTGTWYFPEGEEIDEEKLPEAAKLKIDKLIKKQDMVFMGVSDTNDSSDVRVAIKGMIKFKSLNKIWGYFNFVDIDSYRECYGYTMGADTFDLSDSQKEIISEDEINFDDMFSEDMFEDYSSTEEDYSIENIKSATKRSGAKIQTDSDAYNLIFVKLKDKKNVNKQIEQLNKKFDEEGLHIRAIHWKKAMGVFGSMAGLIKTALNVFVIFLFFVAAIIIMNTISMSVLERSAEIAMMRAVGAQRSFIILTSLTETAILIFVFGIIGILLGFVGITLISIAGITTDNDMLQLLYGGDKFTPIITIADFIIGLIILSLVTIISVISPLLVAIKIKPLDAISRD